MTYAVLDLNTYLKIVSLSDTPPHWRAQIDQNTCMVYWT